MCATPCYPIKTKNKKQKTSMIFQGLKTKAPEQFPLVSLGLPSFQLWGLSEWNSKLLMSWARSFLCLFSKKGATTRLFLVEGLLKPKSPHSWTSLLEFHTSFLIRNWPPTGQGHTVCPTKLICRQRCGHIPDVIKTLVLRQEASICSSPHHS